MDATKIEAMKCGAFNNKSYFGYSGRVLKSAICKYYRRELFEKFEWCVMEMMIFGYKSKGLLTNVINRLKILIMEEIVCSEISIVVQSVTIFAELNKLPDDGADVEKCLFEKIKYIKMLCDILVTVRSKGRACSYVSCWWRFHLAGCLSDGVVLKKVLRYKKKGDCDELLKYGELLINYIADGDERLFAIYNLLISKADVLVAGKRYKRSEPVYLFWEIVEDAFCYKRNKIIKNSRTKNRQLLILNETKKLVFDFALEMFKRRDLKERVAFGVWIGLFLLKTNEMSEWDNECTVIGLEINVLEYLTGRKKIVIDEDFVINDWHVNKKFSLQKFAEVGAFVLNEDVAILGEDAEKYKKFYIEKKIEADVSSGKVVEKCETDSGPEFSGFSENFALEKVFDKGVCSMKKPCMLVRRFVDGERVVLKYMSKTLNYGIDYECIDSLKSEFALTALNVQRITCDIEFSLVDKTKKNYGNNWKLETGDVKSVWCMMKYYENAGDVGENKEFVCNKTALLEEMYKIRLFDGLFRSSDNNMRNILLSADKTKLISIDEGDLFGKRTCVFGSKEWCVKNVWFLKNWERLIDEFIYGVNKEGRLQIIVARLKKYGFEGKVVECIERYNNYKEIIRKELL
jgi:hypothetical protein